MTKYAALHVNVYFKINQMLHDEKKTWDSYGHWAWALEVF